MAMTRHGLVSADGGTLVDFRITGNSVRITTTDTSWDKQIVRVSISAARVEYRRLLKTGYRASSACMSR
jgi:hypothetical protein